MYKALQNKKYYLAFNTFPITAKGVSGVYLSGIRNWISDDMYNYSLVIHRFRIIFSIKRQTHDCANH
jgi:hypothetical protein